MIRTRIKSKYAYAFCEQIQTFISKYEKAVAVIILAW